MQNEQHLTYCFDGASGLDNFHTSFPQAGFLTEAACQVIASCSCQPIDAPGGPTSGLSKCSFVVFRLRVSSPHQSSLEPAGFLNVLKPAAKQSVVSQGQKMSPHQSLSFPLEAGVFAHLVYMQRPLRWPRSAPQPAAYKHVVLQG